MSQYHILNLFIYKLYVHIDNVYIKIYNLYVSIPISLHLYLSVFLSMYLVSRRTLTYEYVCMLNVEYFLLTVHVHFELQKVILFENRVFVDVIK